MFWVNKGESDQLSLKNSFNGFDFLKNLHFTLIAFQEKKNHGVMTKQIQNKTEGKYWKTFFYTHPV